LRVCLVSGGVATAIVYSPVPTMAPSSSGLGHHPLKVAARVRIPLGLLMSYAVDFVNVSTVGLESSPVAEALAGLRANEARYFKNKYDHTFILEPAGEATAVVDWVRDILAKERDLVIASRPLEATAFEVDGIRMA